MSEPWQQNFAHFVEQNPGCRDRLQREVLKDIGSGPGMEYAAGYRAAFLEIFNWYRREVTDIDLARFAPGRDSGQP